MGGKGSCVLTCHSPTDQVGNLFFGGHISATCRLMSLRRGVGGGRRVFIVFFAHFSCHDGDVKCETLTMRTDENWAFKSKMENEK